MLRTAAPTPNRPSLCSRMSVRGRIPLKALLKAYACGKDEVVSACPKIERKKDSDKEAEQAFDA